MRNYWLEEIRIREAVQLISDLLNDHFKGDLPQPQEWMQLIQDLVDTLYTGDLVIIDGLVRYEILCDVDDYGLIDKLELVER